MTNFSIQTQRMTSPDYYFCRLSGSIDMKTALILEENLFSLAVRGDERLLLDMSAVEYINSQGLSVLLELQKRLSLKAGGVALAGAGQQVKDVISMTGVYKVVSIYKDTQEALSLNPWFQKG